jgi:hypothetical protein
VRGRKDKDQFEVTGVAERLAAYGASEPEMTLEVELEDDAYDAELVERGARLLAVMPRRQLRATIEDLLSPHDRERGRRAVDALIDAAFAIEDETGHIRKVA